jgi:hypothetical protein
MHKSLSRSGTIAGNGGMAHGANEGPDNVNQTMAGDLLVR